MRLGWPDRVGGLRAVALFWAAVLGSAALGAVILQLLGPPAPHRIAAVRNAATPPAATPSGGRQPASPTLPTLPTAPALPAATPPAVTVSTRPGRDAPGPIAAPDPALLEPSEDYPGTFLPRIATDGRTPSQVYARGFDRTSLRPRIAVIVAGVGLNGLDSEDAIRTLPGEITLAFSPYASHPEGLLQAARAAGHEFLVSLPMEPQGYPLNDAGDHALLTGASSAANRLRLDWALTRIAGYAGVTNALGILRGERFSGSAALMAPVLYDLSVRGLFYVDARPGQPRPPIAWGRTIDLVIDEPAVRTEIEAKLALLEQIARDKGSAIGLAGAVRPVTVDRLAAWANGLTAKGLALAPASALMLESDIREGAR